MKLRPFHEVAKEDLQNLIFLARIRYGRKWSEHGLDDVLEGRIETAIDYITKSEEVPREAIPVLVDLCGQLERAAGEKFSAIASRARDMADNLTQRLE